MLHANLAAALREVETATQARDLITQRISAISERLAHTEAVRTEVTSRRAAGIQQPDDAGVFLLASADGDVLRAMLETAQAEAEAIALERAESRVKAAKNEIARNELQNTFDALQQRATELDAALLACVQDLRSTGHALGKLSLSSCWTPSAALRTVAMGFLI